MNNHTLANRLLARLPDSQYGAILSRMTPVQLNSGQVVQEVHKPVDYSYFPTSGTLSVVVVLSTGKLMEVATVGREGGIGLPTFVDAARSPHRVFSQVPGAALRIELTVLQAAAAAEGILRKLLFQFQAAVFFQASQSVACNGMHVLEERCCRWLCMTHDRVDGDDIELTHEALAAMFGVRRSSVTEALQDLKLKRLINYVRGKITVLDRHGLEECSCECYRTVTEQYRRLLAE